MPPSLSRHSTGTARSSTVAVLPETRCPSVHSQLTKRRHAELSRIQDTVSHRSTVPKTAGQDENTNRFKRLGWLPLLMPLPVRSNASLSGRLVRPGARLSPVERLSTATAASWLPHRPVSPQNDRALACLSLQARTRYGTTGEPSRQQSEIEDLRPRFASTELFSTVGQSQSSDISPCRLRIPCPLVGPALRLGLDTGRPGADRKFKLRFPWVR
jgi:hypothetical protein